MVNSVNIELISCEAYKQACKAIRRKRIPFYPNIGIINTVVTSYNVERMYGRISLRLLLAYSVGSVAYWNRKVKFAVEMGAIERIEAPGYNKSYYKLSGTGQAMYNEFTGIYKERYNHLLAYYAKLEAKRKPK